MLFLCIIIVLFVENSFNINEQISHSDDLIDFAPFSKYVFWIKTSC